MENKQEASEKGQEINADFKGNRGLNPDGKTALDKDLINPEDYQDEEGGDVVKSSDPESQEWNAREDVNQKEN